MLSDRLCQEADFMGHNKKGFTLIELLIAITILAIIVALSADTFRVVLKQAGQEAGIVSTQIDNLIGLNMLSDDIEHAGYGLPESFKSAISYSEATTSPASTYNSAPSNVPKAFSIGNNTGYNSSDYLVIRSTMVGTNNACTKWTYITNEQKPVPKSWGATNKDLNNGNRVIVIKPAKDIYSKNELIVDSDGNFFTSFSSTAFPADFSPQNPSEKYIIYGVDANTDLRMPFNRADYYINRPTSGMPSRCAPNTGILYKTTINQSGGGSNYLQVFDCVADMQVIFGLDNNEDGVLDTYSDDITSLSAVNIKKRVKEVRVYILTHEGNKDNDYTYPSGTITIGEFDKGHDFNLTSTIGSGWQNYKWKQRILVLKPKDL